MEFILNRYSFVLISLIILIISFWLASRVAGTIISVCTMGIILFLLIGFQLIFSSHSNSIESVEDLNTSLNPNKPVLIMLYSNYWVACLSAKPEVDRLESKLKDNLDVGRIDISSEAGRHLRSKYAAKTVPTFLVLGRERDLLLSKRGIAPNLKVILSLDFKYPE